MKRVLFAVGMAAAPVLALACSGSPNDPSSTSGENLNWRGEADGAAWAFDGAIPPFPGLGLHHDGGFPFPISDGGFPFVLPDGAPPFELPDSGFGDLPPWFKWPDGKFHLEPCDKFHAEPCNGGFKFALPTGGFACPGKGGGFTYEGSDGGFVPPPEFPDSGFVWPVLGDSRPDAEPPHEEPPPVGNRRP